MTDDRRDEDRDQEMEELDEALRRLREEENREEKLQEEELRKIKYHEWRKRRDEELFRKILDENEKECNRIRPPYGIEDA